MIKRTLSSGIKVLKISTLVSVIFSLIIVLVVGFFVIFPILLKAPIENQLSSLTGLDVRLSKITFYFENIGIVLKVHDIAISSNKNQKKIAIIKKLSWHMNLFNLFNNIYHPSKIYIDTLMLYFNPSDVNINNIVSLDMLEKLYLFEFLHINKIIIKHAIKIAPLTLKRDGVQFLLTIPRQDLVTKYFNVTISLSNVQVSRDGCLTLPITVSNDDFKFVLSLKLYNQKNDDFIQITGLIKRMDVVKISDYLPVVLIGSATYQWIKQAFQSGTIDNININIKKNLSKELPAKIKLNAHLTNTELLFNSDWHNLKQLDADIYIDDDQITVMVNHTTLNEMFLQDIKVQILDMSKDELEVSVVGQINTYSGVLTRFLKEAPLDSNVSNVLKYFSLSGKVIADVELTIPLNKTNPVLDIDLNIKDNRLTIFDSAIVVKNYNAHLVLHNNQIISHGMGNIRGKSFDIHINYNNQDSGLDVLFAVVLTNSSDNFEFYLAKYLNQSWQVNIKSDALKTDAKIILDKGVLPEVKLTNLQVTGLDKIKGNWNIR